MLICIYTKDIEETFNQDINSVPQLINFLQEVRPDIWEVLKNTPIAFGLLDSSKSLKPVTLYPETWQSTLDGYDVLIIGSKIEGNFPVPIIIAATLATAIGTTVATAAMIIATVVNMVIMVALSMLMQMLMPTPQMDNKDPAARQKSLTFNGIQNITEQGGAIPLTFGKCKFGGVKVGQILTTFRIEVSEEPTPDTAVPEIAESSIPTVSQGKWYRVI